MPASPDRLPVRKVIAALVFGLGGVAILLALGIWQVQRLAWKTEIIDRIEARLAADPVPLPAAPTARWKSPLPALTKPAAASIEWAPRPVA